MALAEIDGLCRHQDPNPVRWKEHAGTAQARATAAMRAADAPSSRQTVTDATMISGRLAFLIGGPETGGSTITAANSTASSGTGRISLPCRAIVRQVERRFARNPCRSATSFTFAPGRRLSETICAFTSSGQCRRTSRPDFLAVRTSNVDGVVAVLPQRHGNVP